MKQMWAIPVYRLTADGYSVPRGSYGLVESQSDDELRVWLRWLPPRFYLTSGPVQVGDLELCGELVIPEVALP